jgi:tetratricopeptide (TPR) repeat protein
MRILSLIAVVLFVSSLAACVEPGMRENCVQDRDRDLQIRGCTAAIRSGQYSGKDLAAAYYHRGFAYRELGDYRRAIEDYDQVLRLDPGKSETYNNRAWALYLLGRNTEALEDADQSLSLRPDHAATIDTRAHVLAALGRRSDALAEFERAMQAGARTTVRRYQEALARHGHYAGAIDGVYGPEVRAALVACLEAECRLLE